ncbi:MAG: DUF2258 domain-containing protein [Thermosphaera sp.]
MSETSLSKPLIRELNTGIVISGGYATKVRRTLFAQLRNEIKNDKNLAREAARASAELNRVIYHVLVESLRTDKGDAVRIRVKYRIDEPSKRIVFDYNTLKLEVFKRIPDEQVSATVEKVLKEKLEEVIKQYSVLPVAERVEEAIKPEEAQVVQQSLEIVSGADLLKNVKSIYLLGETALDGLLFKMVDHKDQTIGMVTLEPSERGVVIDAIIIMDGRGYRFLKSSEKGKEVLAENTDIILQELASTKPVELGAEEANNLIQEKISLMV